MCFQPRQWIRPIHEQMNDLIKRDGGVIGITDNPFDIMDVWPSDRPHY